ncbi:MAG: hypothetical protein DRQ41_00270, partial [Gammaproteobacteria bacterium]
LYLEPFFAKYEKVKYAYLIELKYITRGDFTKKLLQEKIKEAKNQLQQYATDSRVIKGNQGVNLRLVMLIFSGWELIHWEEVAYTLNG